MSALWLIVNYIVFQKIYFDEEEFSVTVSVIAIKPKTRKELSSPNACDFCNPKRSLQITLI